MKLNECIKNSCENSNNSLLKADSFEWMPDNLDLIQHYVVPWELMENDNKEMIISQQNTRYISDWFLPLVYE